MGSIFDLLNPASNPSTPTRPTFPQPILQPEADKVDGEIYKIATRESHIDLSTKLRGQDVRHDLQGQTVNMDIADVSHIIPEKEENRTIGVASTQELSPSSRKAWLETVVDGPPSPLALRTQEDGRNRRRTSSSQLADLLNPAEDTPAPVAAPARGGELTTAGKPSSPPTVQPEPVKSEPLIATETITEEPEPEERMDIDIVETTEAKSSPAPEERVPQPIVTSEPTKEERPPQLQPSHTIERPPSTDSQQTIDDPVDTKSVAVLPSPSRSPSPPPPRKRKFTPESSPEEPLQGPRTQSMNIDEDNQPEQEPVQPVAREIKKPKKPITKKPITQNRKPVSTAPKKPKVKRKVLPEDLDEGTPASSRQTSITPSEASSSDYEGSSKEVYCICRKPDNGTWMINCEICNDWFHGTCVNLEESDEPLIDTYICPNCTAEGKGKTSWIRKCRLDGCKRPAIQAVKAVKGGKSVKASKYCSPEHAVEFFRQKLNDLDGETLTKGQLKALVTGTKTVEEFKSLGDSEPIVPKEVLMKHKTQEDDSRLADLRLEREKILRKMEIVQLRQTFLHLAVEKTKQLNMDLKSLVPHQLTVGSKAKPKSKPKEICGYDDRLSLDDAEFLEWSATDEGKRVFGEKRIEDDRQCTVEKRRCRHTGWQALRGEDILMEESSLRGQLDGISRMESIISERQKVRARNAYPGNGEVIAFSS